MKYIALDFGNSRVKCYAQGPQLLGAFAYSASEWDSELLSTIMNQVQEEECLIGISSVNPAMDQQFNQVLDEIQLIMSLGSEKIPFEEIHDYLKDNYTDNLKRIWVKNKKS